MTHRPSLFPVETVGSDEHVLRASVLFSIPPTELRKRNIGGGLEQILMFGVDVAPAQNIFFQKDSQPASEASLLRLEGSILNSVAQTEKQRGHAKEKGLGHSM